MTTRREIVKAGAGLAAIIAAGKAPAALVRSMLGARGAIVGTPGIPSYTGTTLLLKTHDNTRVLDIASLTRADSSLPIELDWGDGTVEVFNGPATDVSHTYLANGYYMLHINDNVSAMGFKSSVDTNRRVIACYCSIGSKVSTIYDSCFQNFNVYTNPSDVEWCGLTAEELCDLVMRYTGNTELVINAANIGGYSLFPLAVRVRFTALSRVAGVYFYAGGLSGVRDLTFGSPGVTIAGDYLYGWSSFFSSRTWNQYYGYKTLTFTGKTLQQVQGMSNYPWRADEAGVPVYIRGSDGELRIG